MLPRPHRLTRPDDFRRTIRGGRKAATPTVIVYGLLPVGVESPLPVRIGVTVNKAVGGSVTRHRVARKIRHVMAGVLPDLPEGSTWVIRALPPAGSPDSESDLAGELRRGVSRVLESIP